MKIKRFYKAQEYQLFVYAAKTRIATGFERPFASGAILMHIQIPVKMPTSILDMSTTSILNLAGYIVLLQ